MPPISLLFGVFFPEYPEYPGYLFMNIHSKTTYPDFFVLKTKTFQKYILQDIHFRQVAIISVLGDDKVHSFNSSTLPKSFFAVEISGMCLPYVKNLQLDQWICFFCMLQNTQNYWDYFIFTNNADLREIIIIIISLFKVDKHTKRKKKKKLVKK